MSPNRPCEHHDTDRIIRLDGIVLIVCTACHRVIDTDRSTHRSVGPVPSS